MDLAQNIAKKVRKRVVIRVSTNSRLSVEEAKKKIIEIAPKEAGLDPNGIYFDETSGEVWVKVEKPGLIVGRGNYVRHRILAETGWRAIPMRASPLESKVLREVVAGTLKQSEYRLEFLRRLGDRIHRDVIFRNNYVRITALGGFRRLEGLRYSWRPGRAGYCWTWGLTPAPWKTPLERTRSSTLTP